MPSSASKTSRERVRAHRARLRAQGLRPVTFWLPDTSSPEFLEQARRDCLAIAGSSDGAEADAFIEAAFEWPPEEEKFWRDPDDGEAPDSETR